MTPLEIIAAKRAHMARLANQRGADGERQSVELMMEWTPRPKGRPLRMLLEELSLKGIVIRPSSFDAIAMPHTIDLADQEQLRANIDGFVFVEIKTATQERVRDGFGGFFFALTESEIAAAEALGPRHRVALFNKMSGELLLTSVPELLSRARSTNWQLSIQL